ncbi:MAG: peptidylprolyl isomerase [Bacteriovoracaceae bacterium]|nr:peptidylprolyl isomerase [Bacteriovoracaceae bacterium]
MSRVFAFHYILKDNSGTTIDNSYERGEPLVFLEGSGQIIPGLETELIKMIIGAKKSVEVKSADAYGDIHADMVIEVEKKQFPNNGEGLNVGDMFQISNDPHAPLFKVIKLANDKVTLDGNHPMAGKDLFFEVEITQIRKATPDELAHGHAHGADGHGHHH